MDGGRKLAAELEPRSRGDCGFRRPAEDPAGPAEPTKDTGPPLPLPSLPTPAAGMEDTAGVTLVAAPLPDDSTTGLAAAGHPVPGVPLRLRLGPDADPGTRAAPALAIGAGAPPEETSAGAAPAAATAGVAVGGGGAAADGGSGLTGPEEEPLPELGTLLRWVPSRAGDDGNRQPAQEGASETGERR
jgi:hypothetical protein